MNIVEKQGIAEAVLDPPWEDELNTSSYLITITDLCSKRYYITRPDGVWEERDKESRTWSYPYVDEEAL